MGKNKGNILAILLISLLALSLGLSGYLFLQNQQLQKPQIESVFPTPSPSPVARVETANWKTYTNTQYGLSFKYPQTWIENNDSPSSFVYIAKQKEPVMDNVLFAVSASKASSIQERLKSVSGYRKLPFKNVEWYELINYPSEGGCGHTYVMYYGGYVFDLERGPGSCVVSEEVYNQILGTFRFLGN